MSLSSPVRHFRDIPICVSQPRLAPAGAASSSGSGFCTPVIFSPNTSPSPQAIKPWTKLNGFTAHVASSSTSVWSAPNTQWPVLSIFRMTVPAVPAPCSSARNAVERVETAGRFAEEKVVNCIFSFHWSLRRAAFNCFPICNTAGRGSSSLASVVPDDNDTTRSSGSAILRFFSTFSI